MNKRKAKEILAENEDKRTRCERWSRVMGYHRPVESWNPGKRQEFDDRTLFREAAGND